MKRLSGLDATFLYSETPSVHMHTLKVAIVENLREIDDGVSEFDHFRNELLDRLHLLPSFRLRAVEVPLGLHHPVWIEDPDFDIDNHVFPKRLEKPGSRDQLDRAIGEIASTPLRRDRPLWEMWMVEGLDDGLIAYVVKLHHALADGLASAALVANVMGAGSELAAPPSKPAPPMPGAMRLAMNAVADTRRLRDLPGLIGRTVNGVRSVVDRVADGTLDTARPFDAPKTIFNRTLGPERAFASTQLELARVIAVKRALGVTLNDVVLGIVGGGMIKYLGAQGHLPDRSLLATVPVGVPGEETEPRLQGNRLSNLFTSLCTHVEDPAERVRRISATTRRSKDTHSRLGPDVMQSWAEYTPPGPYHWGFRTYSALRFADKLRPAANVIVSNVRGPASELWVGGARLHQFYSVGPILDGLGLNLTAWSYCDKMSVSALTCRRAVPEPKPVLDCLHDALDELCEAAHL